MFHKISADRAFTVDNLMGFWLAFDCDALWLDVPAPEGRYAVLAVGGTAGKPGRAIIDWTCPGCGASVSPRPFTIGPHGFNAFLSETDAWAAAFNERRQMRTCGSCAAVHPASYGLRVKGQASPGAAQTLEP